MKDGTGNGSGIRMPRKSPKPATRQQKQQQQNLEKPKLPNEKHLPLEYLSDCYNGQRTVWSAALVNALQDWYGNATTSGLKPKYKQYYQNLAVEWFASDDDFVGSFIFICGVLELDPDKIRRRLRKIRRLINEEGMKPTRMNIRF